MNDPLLISAAVTLVIWLGIAREVMSGNRRLRHLDLLGTTAPATWPRVSLVLAARNEGKTVGTALPTMLQLDYPDLELIAVDDRSEDETGEVLDRLAATDPRLRVLHVRELPAGWLGKTNALHQGAAQATGEWILFTDADIHFKPDALRRAVAYARAQSLDHLAAVPRLHEHGPLLGICVNAFSLLFALFVRPWRVPNPANHCHGGVGAFNLVRTTTYRKLGGHEPLRLRPDDDMKLGKLMKSGGFSEVVIGAGSVSVAWYATVGALIRGLEKNVFAGVNYRPSLILGAVLVHGIGVFLPFLMLAASVIGPAWWLWLGSVIVMLGLGADHARVAGGRAWHGLFLPVGIAVMDYILLRSMLLTYWRHGIIWRGTHYHLHDLKGNRL